MDLSDDKEMPDETEEIEDERVSSLEWYVLLSYDLLTSFYFCVNDCMYGVCAADCYWGENCVTICCTY